MRACFRFTTATLCGFVIGLGAVATAEETAKPGAESKTAETGKDAQAKSKSAAPISKVAAAEKLLIGKGLKKDDRLFLLDESAAVKAYEDLKRFHRDFQEARAKYGMLLEYDDNLASMQMQQKELQAEATALQQQINSASSNVNRKMRSMVNQQVAPYRQQEAMLKSQASQMTQQINQMKANPPKPDERKKLPLEYDRTRLELMDALKSLEPLVTPLMTRYHEIALEQEVKDALTDLHHETEMNYKLGPSDELKAAAKLIKNLKLAPKPGKPSLKKSKASAKFK